MSTPARYIVTHIVSAGISACIFPIKLVLDTCFAILGVVTSILIEVISILTGDAQEQMSTEIQMITQSAQARIQRRKRHYSAEDTQFSMRKPIGLRSSGSSYSSFSSNSMIKNASDPGFHTSHQPLLKRSDSLRSPTRHRSLAMRNSHLCPIHESSSSMQKAHSVPFTKPKSSSPFSFSNLFQSCANIFDAFDRHEGSEFTIDDSIALVNEVKNKCTCRSLASGETSPPSSTSSWEDRTGRKIRVNVKVNAALRARREMVELEKQMAKLERRRHKSGELREMRRKEQEQQKSLENEQQGMHSDGKIVEGENVLQTSSVDKIIEDSYISTSPEKYNAGKVNGKCDDEGYGSLERNSPDIALSPTRNNEENSLKKVLEYPMNSRNLISMIDSNIQDTSLNLSHDMRSITGSHYNNRHTTLGVQLERKKNKTNKNFDSSSKTSQTLQSTSNTKVFKNNKLQISPLSKLSNNYESNGIKYPPSKNNIRNCPASDKLEYAMENIMKRQDSKGDRNSMIPRQMSRSYPEFGSRSPRGRTISERAEENDMVMPLPIFPKSRKCKSMNNVSNLKHGISKSRISAKYNINPNISAKQALTKEISEWQELVIMSQKQQLETINIPNGEAKINCNPLCAICNKNAPCIHRAINNGSISETIISKSRDSNKLNDKTDKNSYIKINLKNDIKQNGIQYMNASKTNFEKKYKNNGIRNDAMKNAIKRTNLRKLRSKNLPIRRKSKEDIKEQLLDASAAKSNLVSRTRGPKMRNV